MSSSPRQGTCAPSGLQGCTTGLAFCRHVHVCGCSWLWPWSSFLKLLLAVGVCTVTDVNASIFGLLAAAAAVLTTSLQQIYIGQLQKEYSVGSFDLLSQTAPIQVSPGSSS